MPYSRYGVGEIKNGNNTALRGMGNISSAFASPYMANPDNPASYASLLLTAYEVGMEAGLSTITANGDSRSTGSATLSYVNISFPMGKHWGASIGLRPYSRVYYHLNDTGTTDNIGKTITTYFGDGSVNYAYLGVAAKYYGVSLGLNAGYLFGTIRNTSALANQDTGHITNSDFSRYTRLGGIFWKAGIMYDTKLTKKLNLHVGATATLNQDIRSIRDEYWISYLNMGGSLLQDTIYNTPNVKGKVRLPMSYSIGAQILGTDRWSAGIDFSGVQWGSFRNYGLTDSVKNTFKIAAGGEYTPNPQSIHGYLSRVTYRLGFYYGTDYVDLRSTDMNYYALTFGFSLPFKRGADRIHTGFELGKRGTELNGMVKENFFKFTMGISLNDKWFASSALK